MNLATQLPRLRAIVLHSAILSGLRVMYPVKRTYWFDIYKVRIICSITILLFTCVMTNSVTLTSFYHH